MKEEKCEYPERLKGKKPGECSEEQKRICHGHENKKEENKKEETKEK